LIQVAKLPNLKYLRAGTRSTTPISDEALEHLSTVSSLEELTIGGTGITNVGIKHISKLSNLKSLDIFFTSPSVSDEGWENLKELKSLRILSVGQGQMKVSTVSKFNSLTNLSILDLRVTGDNTVLNLSNLVNLRILHLSGEISDKDLACLAKLKNLQWLQGVRGVGDEGMSYLSNLANMERLNIGGQNITDKGLSYLTKMKKLDYLLIEGGDFTWRGLKHLSCLKALTFLRIYTDTNLTEKSCQSLKKELPYIRTFKISKGKTNRRNLKTGSVPQKDNEVILASVGESLNSVENAESRVLHFPKDKSMGRVMFQHVNAKETLYDFHSWIQNEYQQAQGDVIVPPGKEAALFLYEDSFRDLSPLSNLKPDDLFMLSQMPIDWKKSITLNREGMQHITHLTGLKGLTFINASISSEAMKHIVKLQSLEQLYLPRGSTNRNLSYVSQIKSLKRLIFATNRISNAAIKRYIPKMTNLEYLVLYSGTMNDDCLECLAELPNLRELSLRYGNFTDTGLFNIKDIRSIKSLDLINLPITDKGLEYISNMTQLEDLNLYKTRITDSGLVHLKSLKSLKKLDIGKIGNRIDGIPQISDAGMVHIQQIKSLEQLKMYNVDLTDKGLACLAQLSQLKILQIPTTRMPRFDDDKYWYSDDGLAQLAKLSLLEELHVGSRHITDTGMTHLAKLKDLKVLNIANAPLLTNDGLAKLKSLKNLERLSLRTEKVTISGLSHLNALSNLVRLDIEGVQRDDSNLDISGLSKLENLKFKPNILMKKKGIDMVSVLRDDDLKCLKELKDLRNFTIRSADNSAITDAGIAHLRDLPNLSELVIGGAGVMDKSLSYLANIKTLTYLDIAGNFTDEGLEHLKSLKSLRTLSLKSPNIISPKAKQDLGNNLPVLSSFKIQKKRFSDRTSRSESKEANTGKKAPSFSLKTLDGKDIRLEDYRGKVVILHFWAMWCKPCVASTPQLKELYADLKSSFGDDFEMISLSLDHGEYLVRDHIEKYDLTWPQAVIGKTSEIASDYGVIDSVPKDFLIGLKGTILLDPDSPQVDTKAFIKKVLSDNS
jgi:peroxiredoxin/Leucine-rich repeat (LRR) protein